MELELRPAKTQLALEHHLPWLHIQREILKLPLKKHARLMSENLNYLFTLTTNDFYTIFIYSKCYVSFCCDVFWVVKLKTEEL